MIRSRLETWGKRFRGQAARGVLALGLGVSLVARAAAGEEPIDPQLGAPFTVRSRPSLGSAEAAVVVIEVSSFKCTHCRAFHERVFPHLRRRYLDTGQVRWVAIHATAEEADQQAAAFGVARCAWRHGKYWDLLDFLFEHGRRPSSLLYGRLAAHPSIEDNALQGCVQLGEVQAEIAADFREAAALKIQVLPTFILRKRQPDGQFLETRIEGYPTEEHFRRVLAQVLGSG